VSKQDTKSKIKCDYEKKKFLKDNVMLGSLVWVSQQHLYAGFISGWSKMATAAPDISSGHTYPETISSLITFSRSL
jgi:hypothetical protein